MMWEEETIMKTDCFRKKNAGFTLAELLMVIVIIGVLGSIAIPRFFPQKEKAVVAEAVNMMGAIRQGEIAYRLEHAGYLNLPQTGHTWDEIGIDDPNSSDARKFDYVVNNTIITATRRDTTAGTQDDRYANGTITLDVDSGAWAGTHPFHPRDQ